VSSGFSIFTVLSCMSLPLSLVRSRWLPGRDGGPLSARGRVVAGPAVNAALDKARLGQ
jgi:hypothetical protein